jgi:autotransporter translocation and assembly factor TamB
MRRWRRLWKGLAWTLVLAVAAVLALLGAVLFTLQTGWGRNQLRALIVSQANRYLTATLEIGRLNGSLLRGIELDDIRLSRAGEPIIAIDAVRVSYSIRELFEGGTTIRRLVLDRPRIVAARQADGRWNLAGLVRRETTRNQTSGPRRPIRIETIEIHDGSVSLHDPLTFGAAHVPSAFTGLNTTFSVGYKPVTRTLAFANAAFVGTEPDLTVTRLEGTVANGDAGWLFDALHVVTPRSEFTLDGRVDRRQPPTRLDLAVAAPKFAFQEWAGVLRGLRNIAVESAFEARLSGPLAAMATTISLRSNGGDVRGQLDIDTTVPGWHARGESTVHRLDLARWLNRPDRPSDISGRVNLDIDLQLGGHFPRGAFTFAGAHASYLDYEADDVVARGTITATDVQIASATATAYGANVRLARSRLAIDAPFGFHFVGTAQGVDLRQVPHNVPVPHVESTLSFDYDVTGQFTNPFIRGTAQFADSEFLGANLDAGASGAIDTRVVPFHYAGEGHIANVDLNYFGEQLEIGWLRDPRYAGTVRGQFRVDGTGGPLATMVLNGGGRLEQADLFLGGLSDAEVSVSIANGSLEGTYDGQLFQNDPSVPMADPLYAAQLTGSARGRIAVQDLLIRSPELNDYIVDATLTARDSVVRGLDVSTGEVVATLKQGTMQIERLTTSGPGVDLQASGTLELDGVRSSSITYEVTRSDLSQLQSLIGRAMTGEAITSGRLTGPLDRMRFAGKAAVTRLAASGIEALTTSATYDLTVPTADPVQANGQLDAQLSFVRAFGREFHTVETRIAYDAGRVVASLDGASESGFKATADATFVLDVEQQRAAIESLALTAQHTSWELAAGVRPSLAWTDTALTVAGFELIDTGTKRQRVTMAGTWDTRGGSQLDIVGTNLSIDSLTAPPGTPARYGGLAQVTAHVTGGADTPAVAADFSVTNGRIRRMAYQSFAGHAEYASGNFQVDVRLDQAPGVWFVADGTVPLSAFDRSLPPQPMRLQVRSSQVGLTLLEGVTDVVRNVNGQMTLDVTVLGTSSDPHFSGRVDLTDASFEVVSSGARYRRGRLALQLSTDRVVVETLHVEDENGHPLELTGRLGTHELRVGDFQVQVNAKAFQVLHNEYGQVSVDATMNLSGEFESPRLTGSITVTGGTVAVDRILDRTLFQPYSTQETPLPVDIDPIVALNPWERMGFDLEVHVPGTLRLVGDNVQVSQGTPLGLGNINLRAFGDLSLYKDPAQPMYVNGSFDSLTGSYAFQGRRFDIDPSSSINFRGDLNPELYLTVTRVISGVETRVSIFGPMRQPELRLASTPPLDPSDILSLIVFNTSTNELTALQQEQLAIRAGTLAAGFIAAPMLTALERTLGIDVLEVEPGSDIRGGPRVTVGSEIARGLVARFSRQFGIDEYDEATLEYYLSRILRIRATFSDAASLPTRSPFRRVERAGIDLLLVFSF